MIGTLCEARAPALANNDNIPGSPERTTFSDIHKVQDKRNTDSKETTQYNNLTTKDNSENQLMPKSVSVYPAHNHQNFSCASFNSERKNMTVYQRGRVRQKIDAKSDKSAKSLSIHKNQKL